jgi:hypothetical protein
MYLSVKFLHCCSDIFSISNAAPAAAASQTGSFGNHIIDTLPARIEEEHSSVVNKSFLHETKA